MSDLIQRIPPWAIIAIVAHAVILGTIAYLILLERKVAAWVQDRLGPNRVGPKGLLQPIADGLKFVLKEDYRPAGVDRALFSIAPAIVMIVVIISIAVIPWGGVYEVTRTFDVTDALKAQAPTTAADSSSQSQVLREFAQQKVPVNATVVGISTPTTIGTRVQADVTYQYPFQIAKLNIGALFVIAVLSLAVYGIVIGGWASNNKYSFLGGLRATAQMISYEIPLGLSLLCIVVMYGTLELDEIVNRQAHLWAGFIPAWNVFTQPLAFLVFLICIHAEANRAPFDLAEAEQELVGGYHTEYSAMRFALFFLAEYAGMITTSAVCVALFFGGWHFPGLNGYDPNNAQVTASFGLILLRCLVYFVKILLVIFVFMWVRWSLPRFRFDQLMRMAWRALIPLSLALLMTTAIVIYVMGPEDDEFRALRRISGNLAFVFLLLNVLVLVVMVLISRFLPDTFRTNQPFKVEGSRFTTPSTASDLATNN